MPSAKACEISTLRSTDRHIAAMRATSLTAGPTPAKSSRSSLPMLPKKNFADMQAVEQRRLALASGPGLGQPGADLVGGRSVHSR
jgi:hypothetical protein